MALADEGASASAADATFHVKQDGLGFLRRELAELERAGLLRAKGQPLPADASTFCSNDYLGLAGEPIETAVAGGSGASRLVLGERAEHAALEGAVTRFLGRPAALAFSSGYAANLGAVSALAGRGDLIVSDALNHASLVDGARLSRATVEVVPHLDASAAARALGRRGAYRRAFIVTESYFSMDADAPDFAALARHARAFDAALIVDEAHALGVLGPDGRGLSAEAGISPDVLVGTFGKAFGAAGAFVAGSEDLRAWLWNRARSFVFSTGVSPALAALCTRNLMRATESAERRARVLARAAQLREGLAAIGIAAPGFGPIVPWILGTPDAALEVAARLRREGVLVQAIRPPTVPAGTARIRFTVTARHSAADVDALLAAVHRARACLPR